jgi:hypothetical protein
VKLRAPKIRLRLLAEWLIELYLGVRTQLWPERQPLCLISVPAAGMRPADSDVEDPDRAGLALPAVSDDRRDELAISEENSGGQRSGVNGDAVKRVPTASSGHGTNGAGAELTETEGRRVGVSERGSVEALEDGGVGLPPDEGRIKEANRRKGILETFHTLIGAGQTRAAAAKEVGTPYVTLWRWEKAHAKRTDLRV